MNRDEVSEYLRRIGVETPAPLRADAAALAALHRAHLFTVPFENLDIHLGTPISTAQEDLFAKLVRRRRGGFCYELNGLFAALLEALGFPVTLHSARVAREEGGFGPEFDHLALRVTLAEEWLADVGFGDSFLEPLRLAPAGIEQIREGVTYRVDAVPGGRLLRRRLPDHDWEDQYLLSPEPRHLGEFEGMCRFHQTSPESHFTRRRICSLATPNGRISVSDGKLVVTSRGVRTETALADRDFAEALRDHLGVELPVDALEALNARGGAA